MLEVEKLGLCINGKHILHDVSFDIGDHEILMVIGPNGAGKTSLIRAMMQFEKHSGTAYLDGADMSGISPKEMAKQVGVLIQHHSQQFDYTAEEVVKLGRYAYSGGIFSKKDNEAEKEIDEAMQFTGTAELKKRSIMNLSGGELQRVFLAAAFAQTPRLLILDEPTNHLDLKYQIELFEMLRKWVKEKNRTVIAVVHDLNIAYTYGTKALLMNNGQVHSFGNVEEVLSRDNLKKVYEVDVCQWMQNLLKHWEVINC